MNHLTTEEISGDVLTQSVGEPLTWPISEELIGRKVRFDGYVTGNHSHWDYVFGEEYLIDRVDGAIGPVNIRGAAPSRNFGNDFIFILLPEQEIPAGYYHDDEENKLKPFKVAPEERYTVADSVFGIQVPDNVKPSPQCQPAGIECMDTIRTLLGSEGFVAYCRGKAVESTHKKDCSAQDLREAAEYLNRAANEIT